MNPRDGPPSPWRARTKYLAVALLKSSAITRLYWYGISAAPVEIELTTFGASDHVGDREPAVRLDHSKCFAQNLSPESLITQPWRRHSTSEAGDAFCLQAWRCDKAGRHST
jgi:hypothetical protein